VVTLPRQPRRELEPYRDSEFKIKGLAGYTVKFTKDTAGAVTSAIFTQPTGVFTAIRKTG
jgi:hypothetical protein